MNPVAKDDRLLLTAIAVDDVDHVRNLLFVNELIHDIEGNLDMCGSNWPRIIRPGVVSKIFCTRWPSPSKVHARP